jgi:hypothetical protein
MKKQKAHQIPGEPNMKPEHIVVGELGLVIVSGPAKMPTKQSRNS